MDRSNHYEVAFESYLQGHGRCYVAVDETRRSLDGDESVKSPDFLVFGGEARLVVDVKGRRFPAGPPQRPRRVWECWSEQADIDGLSRWAQLAGAGYRGLLVFAYHLLPVVEMPASTPDLWTCRGRRYLFRAVAVADYRKHMRVRSPRWRTVTLPLSRFRSLVRPLGHFLQGPAPAAPPNLPEWLADEGPRGVLSPAGALECPF
jgi:hypothetical protein